MKQLVPTKVGNTPKGVRFTFDVDHEEKRRLMTRLFGKTILFTDQADWSTEDIVLGYRGQYKLEDGFRTLKDSEACCWWPMHHWTDQEDLGPRFLLRLGLATPQSLAASTRTKGHRHQHHPPDPASDGDPRDGVGLCPRPAVRGKTKARSVYVLTKMDTEQSALFDALDLARYQHPSL